MTERYLPTEIVEIETEYMGNCGNYILYARLWEPAAKRQLWLYLDCDKVILTAADYLFDEVVEQSEICDCEFNSEPNSNVIVFESEWDYPELQDCEWLQAYALAYSRNSEVTNQDFIDYLKAIR